MLEHQAVDVIDRLGSRPQVLFLQAVERFIHQVVELGQFRFAWVDVDEPGDQAVALVGFLQHAQCIGAVGRVVIPVELLEHDQ
jgi:hypothetical protein